MCSEDVGKFLLLVAFLFSCSVCICIIHIFIEGERERQAEQLEAAVAAAVVGQLGSHGDGQHLPMASSISRTITKAQDTVFVDISFGENQEEVKNKKEIDDVPRSKENNSQGDDHYHCVICLSREDMPYVWRLLAQCRHGFHRLCIDQWLKINSSCPLCRNYVHVA